ncbi:hypothetical protein PUV54_13145 [Hyphococcus flavus]|uniref:SMP-30/Gluconolactonase/LRE-like region domain-containing protein n=1 Tax=Hyphococcus flavus TaxID=1866326 RepID=A0AAF0CF11_9PROT|nr:hypothetical protein [Hyphococcus flavus]WDI30899.1 hypothetical protein PUV54_13145 [Hyphococcus flavus]
MGKTQLKFAVILGFAGLISCSAQNVGPAKFAHNVCRHVSILDDVTLKPVLGAEDLALDEANGRLFISAYNRRAAEKASKRNGAAPPSGGVYAVPLDALFQAGGQPVYAASLASPGEFSGGLRPHGIHYDKTNKELVFINRTYARDGRKWRMEPVLQRLGANGEVFVGAAQTTHCAANDVVTNEGENLVSFDHASCGIGAGFENIFRLKRSGLMNDRSIVFKKALFANGLAQTVDGDFVLAATRENALLVLDRNKHEIKTRIDLPGGPDNLSVSAEGDIIAAVHPKMLKLAFNRKLGWGRAPSRIIKADPQTGAIDILFDDPKGALFSAATSAVKVEQGLIAGSVTDEGLLVCREKS